MADGLIGEGNEIRFMSPHTYTEDQLVEQPAIQLFSDLGWTAVSALEEVFGAEGTLGRETKGEVVLERRKWRICPLEG